MTKSYCKSNTPTDQAKKKTTHTAKKSKTPEKIFHVPDPEPLLRCSYCGGTDYVLARIKSARERGIKYCAAEGCNGSMIQYDFSATGELRSGMAKLEHLQWFLGDFGLSTLGGSIEEIEAKLFEKLNKATVAFGKFKSDSLFKGKYESLKEFRKRVARNRERSLEKEIRREIPKEQKKGKTRTQINKMMEEIKKQRYPRPAPKHMTEEERDLAKWFLDTEWREAKERDYYWSYLKSIGWILFNSYTSAGKSALTPALLGLEIIKRNSPETFENFMTSCQERFEEVGPSTPDNVVYLEERRVRHA